MVRCAVSADEFLDSDATDGAALADGETADAEPAVIRPLSGIDLARAALARSRQEARARGSAVPAKRQKGGRAPVGSARRDAGDPELLGETLSRLLVERG